MGMACTKGVRSHRNLNDTVISHSQLTASCHLQPVSSALPGGDGVVLAPPVRAAAAKAALAAAAAPAAPAAADSGVTLARLLAGEAAGPVPHDEDHGNGHRGQAHGHAAQYRQH